MAIESIKLSLDTSEYAAQGIVRVYVGNHGFPIRPDEVCAAMRGMGNYNANREHLIRAIAHALVDAGVSPDATLAQLRTAVNNIIVRF
jgi:hypothetical protein